MLRADTIELQTSWIEALKRASVEYLRCVAIAVIIPSRVLSRQPLYPRLPTEIKQPRFQLTLATRELIDAVGLVATKIGSR